MTVESWGKFTIPIILVGLLARASSGTLSAHVLVMVSPEAGSVGVQHSLERKVAEPPRVINSVVLPKVVQALSSADNRRASCRYSVQRQPRRPVGAQRAADFFRRRRRSEKVTLNGIAAQGS